MTVLEMLHLPIKESYTEIDIVVHSTMNYSSRNQASYTLVLYTAIVGVNHYKCYQNFNFSHRPLLGFFCFN